MNFATFFEVKDINADPLPIVTKDHFYWTYCYFQLVFGKVEKANIVDVIAGIFRLL